MYISEKCSVQVSEGREARKSEDRKKWKGKKQKPESKHRATVNVALVHGHGLEEDRLKMPFFSKPCCFEDYFSK